ncbi:Uu.00g086020.m01.CDS01 [Anthostomella pinea]|uniref:Uu.00g086020.m01.CDS01 n=1 Tax=Anthostomella pinea TaxID=933095 RepID=A0AAI8VM06_9PEZI|nr:Uu.00g086020.m01.CDS01 [Anthostomella pinea]
MAAESSTLKASLQSIEAVRHQDKATRQDDGFLYQKLLFDCPMTYETTPGGKDTAWLEMSAELLYGRKGDDVQKILFTEKNVKDLLRTKKILVFLCGGPMDKNEANRNPTMNELLLDKGYWILFPDYRGTGQSKTYRDVPMGKPSRDNRIVPQQIGNKWYKKLRQTDIVRDLESVRRCLLGDKKWETLGQSFGGWVSLTYLSFHPQGLEKVRIAGGLAPFDNARDVYKSLFRLVIERNDDYYLKYTGDVQTVRKVVRWLAKKDMNRDSVVLPKGNLPEAGLLTAQRFLCMGRMLGARGTWEKIHDTLAAMESDIENDDTGNQLTDETLALYKHNDSWRIDDRPGYAVMHEAMYCVQDGSRSNWAAHDIAQKFSRQYWWVNCDLKQISAELEKRDGKLYFSGEMVYKFFFDTYGGLMDKELKEEAFALAEYKWPEKMYDDGQLSKNTVPVNAVSYKEDMHVDPVLSEQARKKFGNGSMNHELVGEGLEHAALRTHTNKVIDLLWRT